MSLITDFEKNIFIDSSFIEKPANIQPNLQFYTTKHGSSWHQENDKNLETCILHRTLEDAIEYSEKNMCTILCIEGKTIKWSAGPNKAKLLGLRYTFATIFSS